MPNIPECRNYREGRECTRSDVRLVSETDEAFVFVCRCCEGINVISKDGIRDKSKFDNEKKRQDDNADLIRRWESRKKIFAVR
jgi:hypothetical protein